MIDYKELVGDIGDCLIAHPSETLCKRILREAADAIEQLVSDYEILAKMYAKVNEDLCDRTKERDAAVADLKEINLCNWCWNNNKHIIGKDKETQADVDLGECGQGGGLFHQLTLSGRRSWCEKFEWRGVRSEENVR